ncbi:MAG: 1-acyl-sn-glycerol-3-phosphate acyltransferase [Rhodothermales bacterium]|nr:1-acyl-sn-glycerol-3-phosphate acyltransferase [Rhodothermales bacterium]MBO6781253.1 1-acyl-sn-glycerol-3-phosphate acyltransferase [Rhodothermales bacterium]
MTLTPTHIISEVSLRAALLPLVRGLWRCEVVEGREKLLAEPCFLYGNHSNDYDPFMVNWPLPIGRCSSGVLTAEYMQEGIVAAALKGIGLLSTRKRVPEPHLIARILRLLRAGRNVLIYPEGGRRWAGRPTRWIPSTAKLFSRAGYPVRPVVTEGSYIAWPRWADWPRPARIRVRVLDPVSLDGLSQEDAIAQLAAPIDFDENVAPEETRPLRAFRPADGIHRLLYRDPVTGEHGGLRTTDGHRITNVDGSVQWEMLPDSRIRDERTGDILLTGDLYDTVRAMPLEPGPDGAIVRNLVTVSRGPDLRSMGSRQLRRVALHTDSVALGTDRIAHEEILFSGVEKNFKLQLTTRDEIINLEFRDDGSALQWEDALFALTEGRV